MIYYYVDSVNGLDTNNGLSNDTAFKTLQALLNSKTSFTGDTTIYLSNGVYTCNNTIITKISASATVVIQGLGVNTILKPTQSWGQNNQIGTVGANIIFNKLIFDMSNMGGTNPQYTPLNMNFNNIVFINLTAAGYGHFLPIKSTYIFYNCISVGNTTMLLRCDYGNIYLYNCYGRFGNGYSTTQVKWDIENNYITTTPQLDSEYKITDTNIPKNVGVYYGRYRWYSFLIKQNNQYYSILPEFYDEELGVYTLLESVDFNKGFNTNELFTEITVETESFKPIDKFNNFQLISQNLIPLNIQATKSSSELITATNDIDVNIAEIINYFNLLSTETQPNSIKLVISIDEGKSWLSYNPITDNLFKLDCNIPQGDYSNFTEEEKAYWEISKNEINENGIDIGTFNSLDFNRIKGSNMRFAYVLNRNTYEDTCETDRLDWSFNSHGLLRLMENSEGVFDVYEDRIEYKSNVDSSMIKINVSV